MRLSSITLHHYNRLNLNPKMKKCTIDPTNEIVIIGGDNGSGKSSICILFFPWPVNKADMDEDGFVSRTWEHDGAIIVDTYNKDVYSFIKDDVELNLHGGLRMQESLFTEHFGVDLPAMRLLTGEHRFTSMSVKQRQYWMSRLDRYQLEKLESVIKKMKDAKKEKEILLTYNNTQLGKYIITDNVDELQVESAKLSRELQTLMDIRFNVKPTRKVDAILTDLRMAKFDLLNHTEGLRRLVKKVPVIDRAVLTDERLVLMTKRQSLTDRLMMLPNQLVSIDGLPSEEECLESVAMLEKRLHVINPVFNRPDLHAKWLYMSNEVRSNFSTATELQDYYYSDINQLQATQSSLASQLADVIARRSVCVNTLTLIDSGKHDRVTCPNCNSQFGRYDGQYEYATVKSELVSIGEHIDRLSEAKKKTDEDIQNVTFLHRVLEYLWMKIAQLDASYVDMVKVNMPSISKCSNVLSDIVSQLEMSVHNDKIMKEITRLTGYIDIHKAFQNQVQSSITTELAELNATVEATDARLTQLAVAIHNLDTFTALNIKAKETRERVKQLVIELKDAAENRMHSELNRATSTSAVDIRSTLMTITHKLSVHDANKQHHDNICENINTLTHELSVVNEVLTVLDGKKGFVGSMYKERAQVHVKAINHFISQLWNYDMFISTPAEAMTFRFPLHVESTVRDDVSCGSKGMLEGIDLAFLLLVRAVCHLGHIPLIVDELGGNLDPVHLEKTYGYLMDYSVDQMVLISHLPEIQSLVGEDRADYIMLSDRHVSVHSLPSTVNSCLTLL